MKFALNNPNGGEHFANPLTVARLAQDAEAAGWDGFFLWDHIGSDWPFELADPWIELATIATTTSRIKLGPMVTPIPRRRPWKLARECVTLDRLSAGRLILGVGLGNDSGREYSAFGEPADDQTHAAMLDEGLELLTGLWSGESFSYEGEHYHLKDVRFAPRPLQEPRIPIWVAGFWPNKPPLRRAAKWDGYFPVRENPPMSPDDFREAISYIRQFRESNEPFDVAHYGDVMGKAASEAATIISEYEQAGVTWWMEGLGWERSLEEMRDLIQAGPPRL